MFLVLTGLHRYRVTGLDDLDNPGAEEDDRCHETVKLTFLPLHFLPEKCLQGGPCQC